MDPWQFLAYKFLFYFVAFIFLERSFYRNYLLYVYLLINFAYILIGLVSIIGVTEHDYNTEPGRRMMQYMGSLCIINIYWMIIRAFFVKNLFSNRFKVNGRFYDLIKQKSMSVAQIIHLYKWIRVLNICLFTILVIVVPVFSAMFYDQVQTNGSNISSYYYIFMGSIVLLIFIICYLIYLLPKSHHFDKCFFRMHIVTLVLKLVFYDLIIVLLTYNITIKQSNFRQNVLFFLMTVVLSLVMDVTLVSRSKTLLQKSIISMILNTLILVVCYIFLYNGRENTCNKFEYNIALMIYVIGIQFLDVFILSFYHKKKGKFRDLYQVIVKQRVFPQTVRQRRNTVNSRNQSRHNSHHNSRELNNNQQILPIVVDQNIRIDTCQARQNSMQLSRHYSQSCQNNQNSFNNRTQLNQSQQLQQINIFGDSNTDSYRKQNIDSSRRIDDSRQQNIQIRRSQNLNLNFEEPTISNQMQINQISNEQRQVDHSQNNINLVQNIQQNTTIVPFRQGSLLRRVFDQQNNKQNQQNQLEEGEEDQYVPQNFDSQNKFKKSDKIIAILLSVLKSIYSLVGVYFLIFKQEYWYNLALTCAFIGTYILIDFCTTLKHMSNFGKYFFKEGQSQNDQKVYSKKKNQQTTCCLIRVIKYARNILNCQLRGNFKNRAIFCNNFWFLINSSLLLLLFISYQNLQNKQAKMAYQSCTQYNQILKDSKSEQPQKECYKAYSKYIFFYLEASVFFIYFGFNLIFSWQPLNYYSKLKNLNMFQYISSTVRAQIENDQIQKQSRQSIQNIQTCSMFFTTFVFICSAVSIVIAFQIKNFGELSAGFILLFVFSIVFLVILSFLKKISPYFNKAGSITLVLVWMGVVTPTISLAGLLITFTQYFKELIYCELGFLGVFILIIVFFINKNLKRFQEQIRARLAVIETKNFLEGSKASCYKDLGQNFTRVKVKNILLVRDLYDTIIRVLSDNQLLQNLPQQAENILAQIADLIVYQEDDDKLYELNKKRIVLFQKSKRQFEQLNRLLAKAQSQANTKRVQFLENQLKFIKQLVYDSEKIKRLKQNEQAIDRQQMRKENQLQRKYALLQKLAQKNKRELQKIKKRAQNYKRKSQNCKQILSKWLKRFKNQDNNSLEKRDADKAAIEKQFKRDSSGNNKLSRFLRCIQDKARDIQKYYQQREEGKQIQNRNFRMNGQENSSSQKLQEIISDIVKFVIDPVNQKSVDIQQSNQNFSKLIQQMRDQGQEVYLPKIIQLLILTEKKCQVYFIKAIFKFFKVIQTKNQRFNFDDFLNINRRSKFSYNDQLLEGGQVKQIDLFVLINKLSLQKYPQVFDKNMPRRLYMRDLIQEIFKVQGELGFLTRIYFDDQFILKLLAIKEQDQKNEQNKQKCMNKLLCLCIYFQKQFQAKSQQYIEYQKKFLQHLQNEKPQNKIKQLEEQNQALEVQIQDIDIEEGKDIQNDQQIFSKTIRKIQQINKKRLKIENNEVISYNTSKYNGWDYFNFIFALIIMVTNYIIIIRNGLSIVSYNKIDENIKEKENNFIEDTIGKIKIQENIRYILTCGGLVLCFCFTFIFFICMYKRIMQVGFRKVQAGCWTNFLLTKILKIYFDTLFIPLSNFLLHLFIDCSKQNQNKQGVHCTKQGDCQYIHNSFSYEVKCFREKYFAMITLALMAWIPYFTISVFISSKFQFQNKTNRFIISESFANTLTIFKVLNVFLLIQERYYGIKFVILAVFLSIVVGVFIRKAFSFSRVYKILHIIFLLITIAVSLLNYSICNFILVLYFFCSYFFY